MYRIYAKEFINDDMAEISDDRFKEEMMRLMKTAVLKIGDNSKKFSLVRKDIDKNTRDLKSLKRKFALIQVLTMM